ncbi:hypothetical protein CDO52_00690 [Nocardiopsis gilva YIM 90087]|uniref:Uncharacterized protein n=1 Tax=Nocardiopsis gilva YIM 90087 TaxID=1235441 RepID=A0A223S043_9ACTN|nr:hypothetical protein [Nocardiopsis gilva]ASU81496.1 hypothetical protein CDO52_00690 [Nocardiopsis gilva YIM 90087]
MTESERDEMRDLLVAISTKLDVVINRQADHESRIRDLYERLAACVTTEDLKTLRTYAIGVVSLIVVVVGGIVGLVTALT